MGWRYLLYTLGAISLFVFFMRFFIFTFRETPKYAICKGNNAHAVKALQHMAKVNKKPCFLTVEVLEAVEKDYLVVLSDSSSNPTLGDSRSKSPKNFKKKIFHELDRVQILFSSFQMTRLTILTWLTYIMDFWGFTVAGFYLPQILAIKNGNANTSLKSTYAAYIYTYAPGILGVLLGACAYRIPSIGRKWAMVGASGLMGAAILLFSKVDTVAKNEGLFTMEYFFQSMFNAVLYGWTPEAFPGPIRGTACGVASFWGRLSGIVGPLIAQSLYGATAGPNGEGDINSVLYLAGGVTLGCVITTALLPLKLMEADDGRS
jgi:hypothetical protein